MKMRLIDADKLPHYNGYSYSALEIAHAVEKAPTVNISCVEWHEVCTRPLTDEECAYYKDIGIEDAEDIFDCEMPDDGQEILIATKYGVDKDICSNDAEYGIGLEGHGDWDGVLAWAAMPKYVPDEGIGEQDE